MAICLGLRGVCGFNDSGVLVFLLKIRHKVDSFRCFYVIRPVLLRCLERTAWLNRHSAHPQLRSEVSAGSPEPSIVGHWQRPEESCQEPRACAVANQSSSEKKMKEADVLGQYGPQLPGRYT